jgi:hypothetical protein
MDERGFNIDLIPHGFFLAVLLFGIPIGLLTIESRVLICILWRKTTVLSCWGFSEMQAAELHPQSTDS